MNQRLILQSSYKQDLPETNCGHRFGRIRGKMFFLVGVLFRKYSNSCQVSELGTRMLRSSGCRGNKDDIFLSVLRHSQLQKTLLLLLVQLLSSFHLSLLSPLFICPHSHASLSHQLSDSDIQDYHDTYTPRMDEMHAFNMVSPPFVSMEELVSTKNIIILVK